MSNNYISNKYRVIVRNRAKNLCEYCLAIGNYAFHPFSVDHVIPISKEGTGELDNLALACQHCNNCKYNKVLGLDPLNQLEVEIYHPRQDKWSEHFIWNDEKTHIIGIISKGRATVYTLKMNRDGAVNLRKALGMYGVHPPDIE